jgi:hypothetical protein
MRSYRFALVVPPVIAIAIAAAACAGGSATIRFDPGDADALAHAALIGETDLPRQGWRLVATDAFDDGESQFAGLSAECQALEAALAELNAPLVARRAGRAQKEFERLAPNFPFPVSVEVAVQILDDDAGLAEIVAAAGQLWDGYVECSREYYLSQLGPEATVAATAITPKASPPRGGAVIGLEVDFETSEVAAIVRLESYTWTYANATVSVTISGPRQAFTTELVTTAVERMDAAVRRAAGETLE